MGTYHSETEVRDDIACTLVQMGFEREAALVIVDTVMTSVDNAALSAMMTVEMSCSGLREPVKLMTQHLTLQILIGRLTAFLRELDADLLASGAKRHDVFGNPPQENQ